MYNERVRIRRDNMLINLSEVFTLEGKEKTWEVPFEKTVFQGTDGKYPVVDSEPIRITVKNLGNRCNNLHPQSRRIRMNIPKEI